MDEKNLVRTASISISAVCFILAVVSYFLLPERIYVEIFSFRNLPETSTLVFTAVGFLLVAVSGLMCIYYSEKGKKWIALQSVLAIAFAGCLIFNLIVL